MPQITKPPFFILACLSRAFGGRSAPPIVGREQTRQQPIRTGRIPRNPAVPACILALLFLPFRLCPFYVRERRPGTRRTSRLAGRRKRWEVDLPAGSSQEVRRTKNKEIENRECTLTETVHQRQTRILFLPVFFSFGSASPVTETAGSIRRVAMRWVRHAG